MRLFISCSNKNGNCFKISQDLKNEDDELMSLSNKNLKYCLGCDSCIHKLENRCVLLDDMQDFYKSLERADKIIFAIPIYFDNVNGLFKNFIDRLNPLYHSEILKNKEIYFITIGEQSEKDNKITSSHIDYFFSKLAEVFEFNYKYLRNFSSGESGKIEDNYDDYEQIIGELKGMIG